VALLTANGRKLVAEVLAAGVRGVETEDTNNKRASVLGMGTVGVALQTDRVGFESRQRARSQ